MVVVNSLDERLDLGALSDALLAHRLGDLQRILLDASNQSETVRTLLRALIKVLDDDSLLSGVTPVEQKDDLVLAIKLAHFDGEKRGNDRERLSKGCEQTKFCCRYKKLNECLT